MPVVDPTRRAYISAVGVVQDVEIGGSFGSIWPPRRLTTTTIAAAALVFAHRLDRHRLAAGPVRASSTTRT